MRTHLRRFGSALGVASLVWCCREQVVAKPAPPAPPAPAAPAALAALLTVDAAGAAKLTCLPSRTEQRAVFPSSRLHEILDVTMWDGKLTVAAVAEPPAKGKTPANPRLLLLVPGSPPRDVAADVHFAQFSPKGDALLVETRSHRYQGGGVVGPASSSQVIDLAGGTSVRIGEVADPRWEADGKHVRATRLTTKLRDRRSHMSQERGTARIRWDRDTGTTTNLGPGSGQLPAPSGTAAAWSDADPLSPLMYRCRVSVGNGGVHRHPVSGRLCQGDADERGIRWSPDGRWLAFASYPTSASNPSGADLPLFLEIVDLAGARHPAVAALMTAAGSAKPVPLARAGAGLPWLAWSPSQRYLVAQDSDEKLWLHDLVGRSVTPLGSGRSPTFSLQGDYLLAHGAAANQRGEPNLKAAFVLAGATARDRLAIGTVRDARWVPASACAGGS